MNRSAAGSDPRGPETLLLGSVPGFIVFDLPGVAVSAGGTRLAPDPPGPPFADAR